MFAPFTRDEVESVRSIVLMGQQQDDMLLSNCSSRPLAQTRSFIRRFKRVLLDSQASVTDITRSANEQYVAIIAGVRVRRNTHRMANATSLANLASPLINSMQTVPVKFRSKYAKIETEVEQPPALPPPLPTRSRSVSEGLAIPEVTIRRSDDQIPVIPPVAGEIPHACQNIDELEPGTLAAVLRVQDGNAIICRVLGKKLIGDEWHALVSFFQRDIKPCFVRPQQMVKLRGRSAKRGEWPDPLTVDNILEQMMKESQVLVMDVSMPTASDPAIQQQQSKYVMFRSLSCAVQLALLSFAAHYKVPQEKLTLMFDAVQTMNPLKYQSSMMINARCKELAEQILARLS